MRGFGWVGALIVLLLIIGAGAIGYNLGLAANVGATGATVVHPMMWGWGFGFPFFGFIFFFLILFLIVGAFRRGRHGYYGHHGYGPGRGYWQGYGDIEALHQQLHDESEKKSQS